mmetsp:Transcript_28395/g.60844  ORF Transcript_28395/g.60844 Transcript_28395/m.60844 type:complete len:548 (-) Transcript_28395:136-1779(-)|eukprot:CAMPEP_0201242026 /NCGR_PEP_ID=MMETSP0852-20130820/36225_1 /ASSEMBLY_ACC=CAM_ASM_000632 /TAXON_ID=183588 /ORGANISM="Pseudo-nitzschia fraudulenta, Strain WWA7" /LENGTH=547 /DNA_ID=CAMNT_0047538529 /DNA_START=89 /DNA_END=1732 /DNA_ORIENTATION=-
MKSSTGSPSMFDVRPLSSVLYFSLVSMLLLSSATSFTQHRHPTTTTTTMPSLRSKQYSYGKGSATTTAIESTAPSSRASLFSLKGFRRATHRTIPSSTAVARTNTNCRSLFARNPNKDDNGEDGAHGENPKIRGRRGARFARRFLRRLPPFLSLVFTAAMLCPARAMAATATIQTAAAPAAVASVAAAAPASVAVITCPVSAATEYRLMVRIVFAALMGAALGKERSFAKHSAGVRTMSLVSMGASVFTVCSCYGFANFPKVDASRMAANVASGVGFVGAGVITTSVRNQDRKGANNPQNNVVHGLTTAATIWLSAAVGVSSGVGLLRVATTAAFSTIFILRMGRKKTKNMPALDDNALQQRSVFLPRSRTNNKVVAAMNYNTEHTNNNEDEDEDVNAEIHITTHWDEHQEHDSDGVADEHSPAFHSESLEGGQPQMISTDSQQQLSRETERQLGTAPNEEEQEEVFSTQNYGNGQGSESSADEELRVSSEMMEEVVRSAWQNNNATVDALVDIVLNRVEEREFVSCTRRVRRRDDSTSSSNRDYLP